VLQRVDAAFQEAAAPQRDLPAIQGNLGGDIFVLPALRSQQHDARSLLNASLDAATLGKDAQLALRGGIQLDRRGYSHRSSPPGRLEYADRNKFYNFRRIALDS
jgi:hypothetical protein